MDKISVQRANDLHPKARASALRVLELADKALTGRAVLRYSHTTRTFKMQTDLYNQGRTTPGDIVTFAKAGESYHNYSLAFDIVLIIDGKEASWDTLKDFDGDKVADWMEVVAIAKAEGWEWGGDWPGKKRDRPHFQKTFGLTIGECKELYRTGNFIPGTSYIRI